MFAARNAFLTAADPDFINFQTMPDGAITTPGWVTTQIGASSALPTISGGRMVQADSGTAAAAGYLTKPLSDSARIITMRAGFELIAFAAGSGAALVAWQYAMPQGVFPGGLQRSSSHVVFSRTGYLVQKYSTDEAGATTLYTRTYGSDLGSAVQEVTMTLDVAGQALTVKGGDGNTHRYPTSSGDALLTTWPGYYACCEIYDANPSVDDIRFLYFGAKSS